MGTHYLAQGGGLTAFCRRLRDEAWGDEVVVEVVPFDPSNIMHPALDWYEAPHWVRVGFLYDPENGGYLPPNEHWVWDGLEGVWHYLPPDIGDGMMEDGDGREDPA